MQSSLKSYDYTRALLTSPIFPEIDLHIVDETVSDGEQPLFLDDGSVTKPAHDALHDLQQDVIWILVVISIAPSRDPGRTPARRDLEVPTVCKEAVMVKVIIDVYL